MKTRQNREKSKKNGFEVNEVNEIPGISGGINLFCFDFRTTKQIYKPWNSENFVHFLHLGQNNILLPLSRTPFEGQNGHNYCDLVN